MLKFYLNILVQRYYPVFVGISSVLSAKTFVVCTMFLERLIALYTMSVVCVWARSGRTWRAADAPQDDDLEPPHEVILPELPSTHINLLSTTFISICLLYSGVQGVTRQTHRRLIHSFY